MTILNRLKNRLQRINQYMGHKFPHHEYSLGRIKISFR